MMDEVARLELVKAFISTRCRTDPHGRVKRTQLYRAFGKWSAVYRHPQMSLGKFTQAVQALGFAHVLMGHADEVLGLAMISPVDPVPDLNILQRQLKQRATKERSAPS
jgi:hypothetical protein